MVPCSPLANEGSTGQQDRHDCYVINDLCHRQKPRRIKVWVKFGTDHNIKRRIWNLPPLLIDKLRNFLIEN